MNIIDFMRHFVCFIHVSQRPADFQINSLTFEICCNMKSLIRVWHAMCLFNNFNWIYRKSTLDWRFLLRHMWLNKVDHRNQLWNRIWLNTALFLHFSSHVLITVLCIWIWKILLSYNCRFLLSEADVPVPFAHTIFDVYHWYERFQYCITEERKKKEARSDV